MQNLKGLNFAVIRKAVKDNTKAFLSCEVDPDAAKPNEIYGAARRIYLVLRSVWAFESVFVIFFFISPGHSKDNGCFQCKV